MEKLKKGDKVYHERYHTYGDNVTYIVETVERLTNTQAILSNGVRLINAPYEHNSVVMYSQYGEKNNKWHISTDNLFKKQQQ